MGHPSFERVDNGFHVGDAIRGVVVDDVEVVSVRSQRVSERARHLPVHVNAASALRHRRFMTVRHGDGVALTRELEHEVQPDVTVTAEDERAH